MNYVPKTNDLILFTEPTSGILSDFGINDKHYNWSHSIVNVEPNQSALVIDTYTIDNNRSNRSFTNPTLSNTLNIAIELTRHHKPYIPQPPTILIVSLSDLIIEVLFDPDLLQPIPHPSNLLPPKHPTLQMTLAR